MFFFIAGFNHPVRKSYGLLIERSCETCGTKSEWHLVKVTSYVTFFFLPLIPHGRTYWAHCSRCNSGYEISREQYETCRIIQNDLESGTITTVQRDNLVRQALGEMVSPFMTGSTVIERFSKKLKNLSDSELQSILSEECGVYSPDFIAAAEEEMRKRQGI